MDAELESELSTALAKFHGREETLVLQAGAGDGVSGDFLHPFLISNRWKAILVEPVERMFDLLCETYRSYPWVRCIHGAVSDEGGSRPFYSVKDGPPCPWWTSQLHSFHKHVVLSHVDEIPDLESRIEISEVQCLRVSDLLHLSGLPHFDIAFVDTEGHDHIIVKELIQLARIPSIILFEHKHLNSGDCENVTAALSEHGFRLVRGNWDTLCLHDEMDSSQ